MKETVYDIAVIGGGPAGSSAALRAVRGGARVLLLEKRPMPRPKLCGGWVSERALDLLEVALPDSLTARPFRRATLAFRDVAQSYFPAKPLGIFVDRAVFDAFLLDACRHDGIDCCYETARRIDTSGPHHTIQADDATWRAAATIICTGANSAVLNVLRPADQAAESAIAVEQRLPIKYAEQWNLEPGDAYLGFGTLNYGYEWGLHHGDYLLVGVGAKRSEVADIRSHFRTLWAGWKLPLSLFHPEGHLIPLGGHKRRLGAGRLLSAGDAAGMVDPFNGEGIAGAIQSGHLAANAILKETEESPADVYHDSCERYLLPELRSARQVAELFHGLPSAIIRSFCSDPDLAAKYHEVLRQQASYSSLMSWMIRRRLFGRFSGNQNDSNSNAEASSDS